MKLDNYNINLNPEKLSDQQIGKHKDFDALLSQFNETPQPNSPSRMRWLYYAGGAVAACLIGFMVYTTVISPSSPVMTTTEYLAEQPYVNPPLGDIQAKFASNQFNATKGGIYKYKNGSRLIVPPAAFIDDNGQAVSGDVNIRYREFHDFVDFFLSGIPMEYDSAGTKYQLESAGMVEIYAEQNGKRLNMAPGKKIDVELVSQIVVPAANRGSAPRFNVYSLDTDQRNWVYAGVDDIELLEEEDLSQLLSEEETAIEKKYTTALAAINKQQATELAAIEATIAKPIPPVKPERADPNAHVFDLDFSVDDIVFSDEATSEERSQINQSQEELNRLRKLYSNTTWQVAPNNPDFNKNAAANIVWDDMKLRQMNANDYELTLIAGSRVMKVMVNPVLGGTNYDQAMTEFNSSFKQYEQKVAARAAMLQDQKIALERRIKEEKQITDMEYKQQIAAFRAKGQDYAATDAIIRQKVLNRFRVSNLGIWNCDRPLPPYVVKVKGEFIDTKSNEYEHHTAYLVNKDLNTVARFYTGKGTDVVYNSSSENMLWLVTKENKLAIFRPEEFKRINQDKDDFTFVLNVVDKKIEDEDDVRQILQF